jgi:hypothetical protein
MRLIGLAVVLGLSFVLAPLAAQAQRAPEVGVLVFGTERGNINIDRVAEYPGRWCRRKCASCLHRPRMKAALSQRPARLATMATNSAGSTGLATCMSGDRRSRPRWSSTRYSMTWSARSRSVCGIVRPRALAVLRLMINSNLVARSTGRSAGRAPLKILST